MDSSLPSSSSSDSTSSSSLMDSFPFMLPSNENMHELCYLQNGGGLGVALMENATLPSNPVFLSAIFALFATQSTKVILNFFKERQWDFRLMFASQGMPSTRSALCSAITTSVALTHGLAHSLLPVSLGFSLIVMSDAVAVTRHIGSQAQVLNSLLYQLSGGTPVLDARLEEGSGVTLPEVLTGALLGSAVAVLCSLGFMLLRR